MKFVGSSEWHFVAQERHVKFLYSHFGATHEVKCKRMKLNLNRDKIDEILRKNEKFPKHVRQAWCQRREATNTETGNIPWKALGSLRASFERNDSRTLHSILQFRYILRHTQHISKVSLIESWGKEWRMFDRCIVLERVSLTRRFCRFGANKTGLL